MGHLRLDLINTKQKLPKKTKLKYENMQMQILTWIRIFLGHHQLYIFINFVYKF